MMDEEQKSIFSLQIDPAAEAALAESARWGTFLAIIGFIFCGLIALCMVTVLVIGTASSLGSGQTGLTIVVTYLIIAVLSFIPCLHLFNYSRSIRAAIASNNQDVMTEAFSKLKSYFKFLGIIAIVVIVLIVAAIVYIVLTLGISGAGV
ncbi:DUF5362 family protein [Dinghuibacter silviterrae]|uniref:Uncharacterized protein n=1 Tax=Dinghuibacter silviterrae TaxID=1539049 RepID=A0A4R8DRS7_9BACT|nr:DUF5362 family protein [Dinghuibacter silviterrae]TDX00922.1 hypothetical protein EDB95_1952 [Dinghuibacter silviterrae]